MFPLHTKVLVVDDMSMFRAMVKQALTAMEYKNFVEASDGEAAWAAIQHARNENKPFDLIISDWTMPKMKGIELLKKVRAEEWGKTFPFILLTGEAERGNIMEAIQSGVSQYMIKPFTVADLKTKMKQAYDKSKHDPNIEKI